MTKEIKIVLRKPHPNQQRFKDSTAKRKIIKAGRRGGKTVGVAIKSLEAFLDGRRVLYAAPTGEQTDRYWYEIKRALQPAIDTGVYKQNETERYIEKPGTENRIKAKTAWNANTLRGDYADLLVLDEWQLMAEDTWDDVGAPMLIDNNGDAIFIYTPPSLKSSSISRATDPRHASKMYAQAQADKSGRWEAFHFTSHDNPYLSDDGLLEVTKDMSRDSYLKEIMAEDDDTQSNLLVYGCWNENVCKVKRFEIPQNWLIYSGHDFGSANPGALFVAQDPGTQFFYCFREYMPSTGRSTFQNVQEFKQLITLPGHAGEENPPLYNVLQRVGGNRTSEDEIRQGYSAQGWPITQPYISAVGAQIDRVKQWMEKNKIFVFEDMYGLLEQLNTCLWRLDEYGKPTNIIKDEARYHLLACLRYLFSLFPTETLNKTESSSIQDLRPSHVGARRLTGIQYYRGR
jgi:hypothetical protein